LSIFPTNLVTPQGARIVEVFRRKNVLFAIVTVTCKPKHRSLMIDDAVARHFFATAGIIYLALPHNCIIIIIAYVHRTASNCFKNEEATS
jgi:hypothetical protein